MKKTRTFAVQRWGKCALTLLLACALLAGLALSAAARESYQGEVVDPAIPKPVVTVQGNLVVDRPGGKPTGFYELALCVRSGRTITDRDGVTGVTPGSVIDEAAYEAYLATDPTVAEDPSTKFDFKYWPFSSAGSAVTFNSDALTAVNWAIQNVTYEEYDATNQVYKSEAAAGVAGSYLRGIDTDPDVQGYDPTVVSQAEAFPDITGANVLMGKPSVAIDVEADPRMFEATGQVDHYDETSKTALLTLTASAPDNKPIILKESTPLVVARFSYDLKRFANVKVNELDWKSDARNAATGGSGEAGFWLGWDKTTGLADATLAQKTPLTWLGASDATALYDFSYSDYLASRTRVNQTAWVHMAIEDAAITERDTYFYYYLGAEDNQNSGQKTLDVVVGGAPTAVQGITMPKTEGEKVLTEGTEENPVPAPAPGASPAPTQAGYTYFKNLLRIKDGTMAVELVNAETFKKPAGVGGNQILFYDWDDTLLGALIVGDGDVREAVNAYVEKNMVHPDLRAGSVLANQLGGNVPDYTVAVTPGSPEETYAKLLTSLDREWTYRGKYSSKVDGTGVVRDEAGETAGDPNSVPGSEYKLTNKIDYAFYRHLDAVTTVEYEDAGGAAVTERYVTSNPLTSDADAAQYPWVYGWAIVEDNSPRNQKDWQVRRDAAQVENTWTTFGVGELENADPAYDMVTNAGVQAVPTALPAGTTAVPGTSVGGGTGIETNWPDFVDTTAVTAPTDYSYKLDAATKSDYLRFADFSDMKSQMPKSGQNVLVVKAVYEQGPELTTDGYRMISEPYYNKLNSEAASAGGAYSVSITVERVDAAQADGYLRGSIRMRDPAVRQDTTIDQKWIEDSVMGVENDLANPSINTAMLRTQTTYTKVDTDNGEEISFTLALSARQNKINYFLTEMYGYNFVTGTQRTITNFNRNGTAHVLDNYNYLADDSADNDAYYDKQGYYLEVPRFGVKDGSHGYVLYGTLNYLMEQATYVARGEKTRAQFNAACGYAEIADMNLCLDGGATLPSISNQNRFREAILAAAEECVKYHQGDPDYWNVEHGYAELTYHQLQHYLTSGTLMDRASADALGIDWCHLHKVCFKDPEAAAAPKDWNDIVSFAADPGKADGIGLLTGGISGKVEELTHLRATLSGDPFPAGSAFQAKIVEAVAKLTAAGQPLSWVNIQYYIVEGLTPTGDQGLIKALSDYWWYDGAVSKPTAPTDLAALAKGAKAYTSGATLKDGATVAGWTFGLQGVVDVFLDNDAQGPSVVSRGWIQLTENLVAKRVVNGPDDESTVKFATYYDFETALLDAMDAADKAGVSPAGDTPDPLYWHKLQYHILHKDEPGYIFPAGVQDTDISPERQEMQGYWWHNGGKLYVVKDLQTMLEVAKLAVVDADPDAQAAWAKFTSFTGSGGALSELLYSKDFKGTMYQDADMATFKSQIETMVTLPGAPTLSAGDAGDINMKNAAWRDIQYYLIHGSLNVSEAGKELAAGYYWWKDGGTPTAPNIVKWQDAFTAAFAEQVNGNTVAWDKLDSFALLMLASNLRDYDAANPPADPIYKFADLPQFTTAQLKAAAIDYVTNNTPASSCGMGHAPATPTWFQLQHYLKNGSWDVSGISQDDLEKRYWWFDGKAEDPNKPVEAPDKPMTDWIAKYMVSDATITAMKFGDFNVEDTTWKGTVAGGAINGMNVSSMKTRLKNLRKNAPDPSQLTWYQIQTALWPKTTVAGVGTVGNGAYVDPATAAKAYHAKVTAAKDWRPQWAKDLYDETTGLPKAETSAAEMGVVDERDPDAIQARIEELEAELERLRKELEAAQEATLEEPTNGAPGSSRPTQGADQPTLGEENGDVGPDDPAGQPTPEEPTNGAPGSSRPTQGADTPTPEPDTPEPDVPETPEEPGHDEREETPLGEDAWMAGVLGVGTPAARGDGNVGASCARPEEPKENVGPDDPAGQPDADTPDSEVAPLSLLTEEMVPATVAGRPLRSGGLSFPRGKDSPLPARGTPHPYGSFVANGCAADPPEKTPKGGNPRAPLWNPPSAKKGAAAPSLDSPPGLSSGRLSTHRACSATPGGFGGDAALPQRVIALTPSDWRRGWGR